MKFQSRMLLLNKSCLLIIGFVGSVLCGSCNNGNTNKQSEKRKSVAESESTDSTTQKIVKKKPNLVFISLDTLRRDHLTIYGYSKNTSQYLQRLSEDCVIFDSAIAAHTNTAPSHATMFTGLSPGVNGIRRNGMRLRARIPTMASILKTNGYATGGFVSGWTMTPHTQLNRGFDEYNARFPKGKARRPGRITWAFARVWMRQQIQADKPFFLFLHLFDPHFPYNPPPNDALLFLPGKDKLNTPVRRRHLPGRKRLLRLKAFEENEYVARYDGEIVYADRVIGDLINELNQTQTLKNTILIFLSDHGETLFERAWVADHGGRAYDEQIRVPLMIRLLHSYKAGTRIPGQVMHVDILPTVLDLLDIDVPGKLEGQSLMPLIHESPKKTAPRPTFSLARPETHRVPEIRTKLTKKALVSTIRLPNIKLIEYPMKKGGWYQQLFDLRADPEERRNIAHRRPLITQDLHKQLESWRIKTGIEKKMALPVLSKEVEKALKALGYVE